MLAEGAFSIRRLRRQIHSDSEAYPRLYIFITFFYDATVFVLDTIWAFVKPFLYICIANFISVVISVVSTAAIIYAFIWLLFSSVN